VLQASVARIATPAGLPLRRDSLHCGLGLPRQQWRGTFDEPPAPAHNPADLPEHRRSDSARLLDESDVEYVYVGPFETSQYQLSSPQIDKFGRL